jgi:hypothetical protein
MASPSVIPDCCPQCGASLPPVGDERITCAYCGVSLIRRRNLGAEPAGAWGLRLKMISYVDQQGVGVEAFRMLIPADWEFEGGVQWLMNNPGTPAVVAFRAYNPQGEEAFEAFPSISCYWTNNPMITTMFPVGSLYYGNEVRPPAPALQVLREIVVPRYRGQMPGLQFVDQEHLPDLPQALQAASPADSSSITSADGARVRICYRRGDRDVEEDVFGVVEVSQVATPMLMMGAMENVFWIADYIFSFRALAGQLDGLSDMFLAMMRSFRLNPQWYGRYVQVSQYLIQNQIQQIRHIGQISQIVSRTSDQISDMMMDSYYQRQQTLDQLSTQFSQAIRGVDEYYDSFEQQGVELPGGYDHAWSNSLGEYILTDDPNFDPNVGSNLNWEPMKRQ